MILKLKLLHVINYITIKYISIWISTAINLSIWDVSVAFTVSIGPDSWQGEKEKEEKKWQKNDLQKVSKPFKLCCFSFHCSFPARAVTILKEARLHPMLLESLSIDSSYWENQGGQPAIEDIIDVIDRRAGMFLKYISSSQRD